MFTWSGCCFFLIVFSINYDNILQRLVGKKAGCWESKFSFIISFISLRLSMNSILSQIKDWLRWWSNKPLVSMRWGERSPRAKSRLKKFLLFGQFLKSQEISSGSNITLRFWVKYWMTSSFDWRITPIKKLQNLINHLQTKSSERTLTKITKILIGFSAFIKYQQKYITSKKY